jgi:APA family basic amino acid/polyamine antiporter
LILPDSCASCNVENIFARKGHSDCISLNRKASAMAGFQAVLMTLHYAIMVGSLKRMKTQPADSASSEMPSLPRVLSTGQATAIVVGTIIGSGIFLVPCEMMRNTGSSAMVYLAWFVGGLLSLFGAMTYAELGTMMPYAGGEYVYLRGAYGDTTAFLYMWTWFAVAKPGSIATMTVGLVRTLEVLPGFGFLTSPVPGLPGQIEWSQICAIAAAWLLTGLNYLGIQKAGIFQLIFTVLKGVLILVVVGLCFSSATGTLANFGTTIPTATKGIAGFMLALIATLWAYDGWSDLTSVAGEVRHPQRSLPIALIGGLAVVGALYMMTNAAIQYVLPASAIAASPQPAVTALATVAGSRGAIFVAIAMAISIFVATNGTTMSGARAPFAAARDGLFFRSFARISPRFQSPSVALLAQAIISTILLLLLKRFEQFFELTIFSEWLFYALTASTVFYYRRKRPEMERPYRVWGYPVLPAIFLLSSVVVLVYSYIGNLRGSLLGTVLILTGVPMMYLIRRVNGAGSSGGKAL